MDSEYFPNRDYECFGSSLANLLLLYGDRTMAQRCYDRLREHEYTRSEGLMSLVLAPTLIMELTGGTYDGILHVGRLIDLEASVERIFAEGTDAVLKDIEADIEGGRIIEHGTNFSFSSNAAVLLILENDALESGHCIVQKGEAQYIDNGIEVETLREGYKVTGIIEVVRTSGTD